MLMSGIFLGFAANVIVKDVGKIAWRLQFGSAFIPSFVLMIGIFFCPESPRWLMKHNKHAKGFRSMVRLRAHPIIAARDFYYSWVIYEEELRLASGAGYFARMRDIFVVPRIRRSNYGASTVMLAQQMCGINSELQRQPGLYKIVLTSGSYLVLQLFHLRKSWIYGDAGLVCFAWVRRNSSCRHDPDSIPYRHQRAKDSDFSSKSTVQVHAYNYPG